MLPESIKSIIVGRNGPLSHEELIVGESLKTLEIAISHELNHYLLEFDKELNFKNPELIRIAAELQCALSIVQSAKTNADRNRVYDLLMEIGSLPH